ncbi:ABC transporter permease [Romboutsia sp.]|uniref:ABC transporter permease n=1 Tax=Romboutsia sp. TaxID=1965302 RepID=UPI003F4191FE
MGNDLSIVLKYIKSYKTRSLAIILSVVLGTALIIGVGTMSRSAQQADLEKMKRELGTHHVRFKDINKEQLEIVKKGKDIKDLRITSYYASTDNGEKLPLNINYASENYLNEASKLIKGRYPKGNHEIVIEEWVLNSMGLESTLNQEITFKLYDKEKPESFKVVGILSDRYIEKGSGICEMFLNFDESKLNKFDAYVEFNEGSEIDKNINDISKEAKFNRKENIRRNNMLIDSVMANGRLDYESNVTAITMSFFAGLVMYSIYSISVYKRIREYGVLKALGSTNFKIFNLMLYELLILSAIALPIGIIIGMSGAQISNKLVGNMSGEIMGIETPFVIPVKMIILAVSCTVSVALVISIFTFIKIRKLAPMDAIRRNLGEGKKIKKNNIIVNKLSSYIKITKSISMRNMFRNKKGFIMIIASMSIGGIMVIKTSYGFSAGDVLFENMARSTYSNGDFIMLNSGYYSSDNLITDEHINSIKNIDGIDKVKTASFIRTRMDIPKDKMLDLNFYKQLNEHRKSQDRGFEMIESKNIDGYTIKQQLKGYNDEMLNSLNDYLVSGEIDISKMKNSNSVVLYMPYTYDEYEGYRDTVVGGGQPVVDIKVGDTVKVKIPKEKVDGEMYWEMRDMDNLDYEYHEFKVGGIVNYSYADDATYSYTSGIDVITSSDYLEKITGVDTHNLVFADMKEGADHKLISKELGKIGSQVPGTVTTDMVEEKIATEKMDDQRLMINYGVVLVIFIISAFNIFNNVSYNISSRTSEFGILRAVGITYEDFKNMIVYEGILYGIISSAIVFILGILLQIRMYDTYGFEGYGMEFTISYSYYLLIIITNILIGIIATYLPARKIKESNIVEAINIVE